MRSETTEKNSNRQDIFPKPALRDTQAAAGRCAACLHMRTPHALALKRHGASFDVPIIVVTIDVLVAFQSQPHGRKS